MKKFILSSVLLLASVIAAYAQASEGTVIEVTGSATLNIIPDRITIEIGIEEYYRHDPSGDSAVVRLSEIENGVRYVLREAGVLDSMIFISDMGNYRDRNVSSAFLMAKRLSATVTDFNQIDLISEKLGRNGISSFNITQIDNSDMEHYTLQGLKAALEAARQKAEFIAEIERLKLYVPIEIVETTNAPGVYPAFSNVAYDRGSGIENMRRIVRHFSVKVRYPFYPLYQK